MFRNSSPPIEPRRREAPTTATDAGRKNGRSDAATATWSRSSTRLRKPAVASIGKVTSTSPWSSRRVTSKPASAKTESIGRLSCRTSARKRSMPAAEATAASRSRRRVPTPRPCRSSATANATSAVFTSRSGAYSATATMRSAPPAPAASATSAPPAPSSRCSIVARSTRRPPWKRRWRLSSDRPAKKATSASASATVGGRRRNVEPSRRMTSTASGATAVSPLSAVALPLQQSLLERVTDELRTGLQAELLHDVRAVRLGGTDRDVEHSGDLLVRVAEGEQAEDVALAVGQGIGLGPLPLLGLGRDHASAECRVHVAAT